MENLIRIKLHLGNAIPSYERYIGKLSCFSDYGGTLVCEFLCDSGFSGEIMITEDILKKLNLKKTGESIQYETPLGKLAYEEGTKIAVSLLDLETQPLNKFLENSNCLTPIISNNCILGLKGMENLNLGINAEGNFPYIYKGGYYGCLGKDENVVKKNINYIMI